MLYWFKSNIWGHYLLVSQSALNELGSAVSQLSFWPTYLQPMLAGQTAEFNLHLAVFVEPYLSFMFEGLKTVESRFSVNRCAPYKKVRRGDVILLKKTGGAVVGLCHASHVWDYALEPGSLGEIKDRFGLAICAQGPEFWDARAKAAYATLIRVERIEAIKPVTVPKRDRRGWVVLDTPSSMPTRLL